MSNRLTIKEFSARIGVSTATVSRAFGGQGRISAETRKNILKLAEEYGYRPNFHGRSSMAEDSGNVCFFYPEIYTDEPDYFISEIAFGAGRTLSSDRLFKQTPYDEESDQALEACCRQLREGRCAGAVIVANSPRAAALVNAAVQRKIPYVIIGSVKGYSENSVRYDNEYGACLAGKYFKDTGRRHPAYVSGHLDRLKRQGFQKGFGSEDIVLIPGGAGFRYGVKAFDFLRSYHPEVDCVLCANDVLAIGLIRAALSHGLRVPEDLAVIGFDDIAISRYCNPALSSVSLHLRKIGETAMELLEKQFQTGQSVQSEVVQCDLVLRQSS